MVQKKIIERKHSEYVHRQRILEGTYETVQDNKLLFFGKFYDVEVDKNGEDFKISLEDQKLRIDTPQSIKRKNVEYEYLKKWIRNRLREILHELLSFYKRKMNVAVNKVYIKNQKTRWGSNSSTYNVNFNIILAALPKNIIEYVVIHELAHNKHRNHSKKFWYTVSNLCPDYKNKKQELNKYSLIIQRNKIWRKMLEEAK